MTLYDKLDEQRHEAMRIGFFDMWGVVLHPDTYHELIAESFAELGATAPIVLTPDEETYIFGLRLIPSYGVLPRTFSIVDERLGKSILGKEKELCMK